MCFPDGIIEEKKRRLGRHTDDTSSKLPRSLANRLGPSPGLHGRVGRLVHKFLHLSIVVHDIIIQGVIF
jgi:hypothetical protein